MLAFICASLDKPRHCCVSWFIRGDWRAIGLVLEQESNEREALQLPLKDAIITVVDEGNSWSLVSGLWSLIFMSLRHYGQGGLPNRLPPPAGCQGCAVFDLVGCTLGSVHFILIQT